MFSHQKLKNPRTKSHTMSSQGLKTLRDPNQWFTPQSPSLGHPKKSLSLWPKFTTFLTTLLTLTTLPVHGGNGFLYQKNVTEASKPEFRGSVKAFETTEIFSGWMNDPITSHLWHEYQRENFQTAPDRIIELFYKNHPFFSQIYHLLEANQGPMLEKFMLAQLTSNRLITPSSDSDSLRVRRLVITVAKKMGFTDQTINNMSLFMQIGGSANAFTVSGSIDHIVVSINMETVKQMQEAQLEAVVAHELFHIVNGHVIKGAIMDLMFGVMSQTLTQAKGELSLNGVADELAASNWLGQKTDSNGFNWKTGRGDFNSRAQRQNINSRISGILRSLNADAREQIHYSIFSSLIKMPEAARKNLIADFLQAVIQGLQTTGAEVPPQVYSYLNSILLNLKSNLGYSPKYSRQEMHAFFQVISETYSRQQETSCDKGAASLVQNIEVASAMSLLILGDRSTNNLNRLRSVLTAQEEYRMVARTLEQDPSFLADLLEGTDHPPINMRINTIMEEFPAYPLILSANGFMRLLLVEQVLRDAAAHPEQAWAALSHQQALDAQSGSGHETKEPSQTPTKETNTNGEANTNGAGKPNSEANTNNAGQSTKATKTGKITLSTINGQPLGSPEDLAKYLSQRQNDVIDVVTGLIIRLEQGIAKGGARNPRFDNLLQFIGAYHQDLIRQHQLLTERMDFIAKQKAPPGLSNRQTEFLKKRVGRIEEELNLPSLLVEKLKQSLKSLPAKDAQQQANIDARLKLLEDLETLAPALRPGNFDPLAISRFQQKVTPNPIIDGVLRDDGTPVFARSRIPYDVRACSATLKQP